LINTPLKIIHF